MHIPTTLKHKPVLVAEDYGRIDGRTAYGSDAQGFDGDARHCGWTGQTTPCLCRSPQR